jgi:hypothetical protein
MINKILRVFIFQTILITGTFSQAIFEFHAISEFSNNSIDKTPSWAKFLQIIIARFFNNIQKLSSNNKIIIWAFLFIIQMAHANPASQSPIYRSNFTIAHKGNSFWHRSNQLGVYDKGGFVSLSFYGSYNHLFDYGVSVLGNYNNFNKPIMPIGFMSKNIKGYNLKIGRWEKSITAESDLSTGSLIRGNNAIPIPQISLSLPDYKKYTILNQKFWIKGGFSHGWFSKGEYVQAPFLHEKYLYIKKDFSNQSAFAVGLVHEAMWGGKTRIHGSQPQAFSDYLRVIFARSASSSGLIGDQDNVLGNHLGIWDLAYTKKGITNDLKLYFQHPFEDKSGAYNYFFDELKARKIPVNSFDGLFGIEIVNKTPGFFKQFLFEYLTTIYQSGPQAATDSTYGMDNYYNHYIYRSGWTYKNRVISNPLFTLGTHPDSDFDGVYILNNRVENYHFGFIGNFSQNINYKILMNYSKNYGTYGDQSRYSIQNIPYNFNGGIKQISALAQLDFVDIWNNVNIRVSYAIDRGELLEDTESFLFSISYNFSNLSPSQ